MSFPGQEPITSFSIITANTEYFSRTELNKILKSQIKLPQKLNSNSPHQIINKPQS